MVVSDHSPSPPDMKTADFSTSWGGISSVQLRLPVTWTGAAERGYGLGDLAEWLSSAPARLAGLDDRKGAIRVGGDADLVVFDSDAWFEVDVARLAHRHPVSPYRGMRLRGTVASTWLGGEEVWSARQVVAGRGRMLDRR
jgi:allantoinase